MVVPPAVSMFNSQWRHHNFKLYNNDNLDMISIRLDFVCNSLDSVGIRQGLDNISLYLGNIILGLININMSLPLLNINHSLANTIPQIKISLHFLKINLDLLKEQFGIRNNFRTHWKQTITRRLNHFLLCIRCHE